MKQDDEPTELVTLSVRVSREVADRLREAADAEYRSVAAELRRLIQERVGAVDVEPSPSSTPASGKAAA